MIQSGDTLYYIQTRYFSSEIKLCSVLAEKVTKKLVKFGDGEVDDRRQGSLSEDLDDWDGRVATAGRVALYASPEAALGAFIEQQQQKIASLNSQVEDANDSILAATKLRRQVEGGEL